jgi:4-amino-4-deoxy-L-arabinose transferase-like glycosyltransferase
LKFLKKNFSSIAIIICCLPVFFLNIKNSHDWGDDFAQYLLQARNIVEHHPQTDNGLVFDSETNDYALRAYPVGFPLMIAPIYYFSGTNVKPLSYLMSTVLFVFCIVLFLYFKKYFSELTAFFLVLIFLYNPFTISFKMEVLSDLPFALLLLVATFLFTRPQNKYPFVLLIGVIAGLAMSTRGIGIIFPAALIIYSLKEIFLQLRTGQKIQVEYLKHPFFIIVVALLVYYILNVNLFPISSKSFFDFYSNAYHAENLKEAVLKNLEYNIEVFKAFFDPNAKEWQFAPRIAKSFAFTFLLLGMVSKWSRRIYFEDILVIAYIIILLVYPYAHGGFRFILPIFPFLIKYIIAGMKCIHLSITLNKKIVIVLVGVSMLLTYLPTIRDTIEYKNYPVHGPQEISSQQAFEYIQGFVPDNAIIAFIKPRILPLYALRKSVYVPSDLSAGWMYLFFNRINVHYFLYSTQCEEVTDFRLKNFIGSYQNEMKILWHNEHFILYSNLP